MSRTPLNRMMVGELEMCSRTKPGEKIVVSQERLNELGVPCNQMILFMTRVHVQLKFRAPPYQV